MICYDIVYPAIKVWAFLEWLKDVAMAENRHRPIFNSLTASSFRRISTYREPQRVGGTHRGSIVMGVPQ